MPGEGLTRVKSQGDPLSAERKSRHQGHFTAKRLSCKTLSSSDLGCVQSRLSSAQRSQELDKGCPSALPHPSRSKVQFCRNESEGGGETRWPLKAPSCCAFPERRSALRRSPLVLLLAGFFWLGGWAVNKEGMWGLPGKRVRLLSVQGRRGSW